MQTTLDALPYIFVGAILLATLVLLTIANRTFRYRYGPEVVTTIGILGTFVGISLAVWTLGSQPNDIIGGLPNVIGGLKLAFVGSAVGVFCSLLIRGFQYVGEARGKGSKEESRKEGDATVGDLVEAIAELRRGLVGNEQGTLLTQLKLQRQEANDNLKKLQMSFDQFAAHMVENNQKALVEALRDVIKDFNAKISEQFGENFKQLNEAVIALVIWQDKYKENLAQLVGFQSRTAQDMQKATNAFSEVVSRSEAFARVSEQLGVTITRMNAQIESIYAQEKALSELLSSMREITPQFALKLNEMLIDLTTGVKNIQGQTQDSIKDFTAQIKNSSSEMKELLSHTIKDNQKNLSESLKDALSKIQDAIKTLDAGLEKELTRSLESLSHQLASLSTKFADDYKPLTERLERILRIAERISEPRGNHGGE